MHITHRRLSRLISTTTLTLGALAGAIMVSPTVAAAASGNAGSINQTTAIRQCGDTRCGPVINVPSGASVPVYCWRDAGSSLGTVRWFRINYAGVTGFVSASAVSRQPQVPYCSDMLPGDRLYAGQNVWSADGRFKLVMQNDGNLVEYGPGGAWWSTMTTGTSGAWFVQQTDGNGVVYDGANRPVWANGTMNAGARLAVQSDGNVVTYIGGTPLYATSQHRWAGQQLRPAGTANPGAYGNCTHYAMERIKDYMRRGRYPSISGNAGWWNDTAPTVGWPVQTMPTSHAVVVFEPTETSRYGHVAWVDAVQARADGTYLHVMEKNYIGFNVVSDRWVRHGAGMSYIPAPSL